MGVFSGGSAYSMARQISDGYVLVTERTFGRFNAGELGQLAFELDRLLREIRADQPAIDDLKAVKTRNRRLQRINSTVRMLQHARTTRRR